MTYKKKGFYKIEEHIYVLIDPVTPYVFSRITPEGLLKTLKLNEEDFEDAVYLGDTSPKLIDSLVALGEENEYESCQLGKAILYAKEELEKCIDRVILTLREKTENPANTQDIVTQELATNRLFNSINLGENHPSSISFKAYAHELSMNQEYPWVDYPRLEVISAFRERFRIRYSLQEDTEQKEIAFSYLGLYVERGVKVKLREMANVKVETQ